MRARVTSSESTGSEPAVSVSRASSSSERRASSRSSPGRTTPMRNAFWRATSRSVTVAVRRRPERPTCASVMCTRFQHRAAAGASEYLPPGSVDRSEVLAFTLDVVQLLFGDDLRFSHCDDRFAGGRPNETPGSCRHRPEALAGGYVDQGERVVAVPGADRHQQPGLGDRLLGWHADPPATHDLETVLLLGHRSGFSQDRATTAIRGAAAATGHDQ